MTTIYKRIAGKKVVLVDDDREVREQIALYFQMKGCRVDTFGNAEAAVESIGKEPPDLVISDLLLPELDGLSFLKKLAREHPRAGMILITGYPDILPAEEIEEGGIDGYLQKPISIEEMEAVLAQVIEKVARPGSKILEGRM